MARSITNMNILESRKVLGVICGSATIAIRSRDTQRGVLEIGKT